MDQMSIVVFESIAGKLSVKLMHHASDIVLELHDIEVDQQSNVFTTELEVRNKLRFVDGQYFLSRLEFNNDAFFHDDVNSISDVDSDRFVYYWQIDFRVGLKTTSVQLKKEACLIR